MNTPRWPFSTYIPPLVVCLAISAIAVQTQPSEQFQWKFAQIDVGNSLVQCQSYPLIAESRDVSNGSKNGVPPYFMTAFVPNGTPTKSNVGNDPNNLTWTVDRPVGATILLSMSDSLGNPGGTYEATFDVVGPSSAKSCQTTQPTENITVVSNITTDLRTCQQWGLRVYGGQKPYTISIAAVGSPVVTNVTLGPTDDVFTYIDRAAPNGHIMASVSDVTGQWGTSTALIPTMGSGDMSCFGLSSSSGNSSFVDQNSKAAKVNHMGAIVGAVIGGVAGPLAMAGLVYYLRRRRERKHRNKAQPAFLPDVWCPPSTNRYPSAGPEPESSRFDKAGMLQAELTRRSEAFGSGEVWGVPVQSSPYHHTGGMYGRPGTHTEPANMGTHAKPLSRDSTIFPTSSPSRLPGPSVIPASWAVGSNVIIQHQDGGATVQELPPPYLARPMVTRSGEGAGGSQLGVVKE